MPNELFGLEPEAGASRPRFALRVYAERIWPDKDVKSSVRKLKRWQAKGREAKDPPPLDDLSQIATWYERHHRYESAPAELRRFETKTTPVVEVVTDDVEEDDQLPSMTLDINGDFSADEGLRQIRALVNATYQQMEIALKQRHTTSYRSLRREWQALINTQRQWEKDILKIQEGKGEVLRTRVINTELVRIMTTSGQSFFNALMKVLQDHAQQLAPEEQRRIALEHRDIIFSHLRGTRFESAWTSDCH
jgi:hypothetical protein